MRKLVSRAAVSILLAVVGVVFLGVGVGVAFGVGIGLAVAGAVTLLLGVLLGWNEAA